MAVRPPWKGKKKKKGELKGRGERGERISSASLAMVHEKGEEKGESKEEKKSSTTNARLHQKGEKMPKGGKRVDEPPTHRPTNKVPTRGKKEKESRKRKLHPAGRVLCLVVVPKRGGKKKKTAEETRRTPPKEGFPSLSPLLGEEGEEKEVLEKGNE